MAKTILAVDDSSLMQAAYRAVLDPEGYEVHVASDGLQALSALRQSRPDLIILDLCLPRVNGWDLLQAVRGTPRWADIPVIVASALSGDDSVACGWSLDCTCYLRKPINFDDLLLLVGRVLDCEPAPALQSVAR